MKKQRVSPASILKPVVFQTGGDLPSPVTGKKEVVEKATKPKEVKVEKPKATIVKIEKAEIVRSKRKRETLKGTMLQAVMVEKDLLKMVKRKAFDDEISLSEVINNAIKMYFH
jgi:uncharacterized Zn finger protein (UPF0148 family)